MAECRVPSFVAGAANTLVPIVAFAEIAPGPGRLTVTGPPRETARSVQSVVRSALDAIALSPPAARIRFEGGGVQLGQAAAPLALPACLALLGAMGALPSIVRRFAAFGILRPDGSIAPAEGAEQAAAHAAERGLGFICAAAQAAAGGAADCVNVIAAPDLLAIVNDFRGTQRQPRPWQFEPPPSGRANGLAEAPAPPFVAGAAAASVSGGERERRLGRLWVRLLGNRRAPARAGMPAATGPPLALPPAPPTPVPIAASPAPATDRVRLPFPTTGPTGHRARLRERVLERGTESLADYELLEMLLFFAFKTGDTKPLAKRLVNQFGSFANVLCASQQQLLETSGLGPHSVVALQLVRAAATRLARAELADQPLLGNLERLMPYLNALLARERVEQFRVLFLDNRNRLIADEAQARGTVNQAPVYPREVLKRALELHATAIILVHNHPSGDPTPSREDIEMTQEIKHAAAALGIALHEHIIVGNGRWLSFRSEGLL